MGRYGNWTHSLHRQADRPCWCSAHFLRIYFRTLAVGWGWLHSEWAEWNWRTCPGHKERKGTCPVPLRTPNLSPLHSRLSFPNTQRLTCFLLSLSVMWQYLEQLDLQFTHNLLNTDIANQTALSSKRTSFHSAHQVWLESLLPTPDSIPLVLRNDP